MELSQQPLHENKVNGFSNGLHPLQVFAYLAYTAAVAVFTICVFPFLDTSTQIVSGVLYYISIGAMAILAVYCSHSDPTDPVIYQERKAKLKNQEFDVSEFEYYCNTCSSHVQNGSKHCRQCERCVNDFDHHCKWLNNCIGKQNYRAFLGLISAVFINSCVYCVFMAYALETKYGNNLQSDLFVNVSETEYLIQKIIVWLFLVFVGILGVLDFNLLLFHIWLSSHKLTTYEYIINSRQAQLENRPYGICAGVGDNRSSSQDKQVPKKLEEHSREPSQTSLQTSVSSQLKQQKSCCCLWRKKENSVSPIIPGQEGFNETELRKHDSLGRHRPFGQNVIEGLIEKSICNSADVREDDMLTEICKQEQQQLDDVELKSGNLQNNNNNNNMGIVRLTEGVVVGGGSGTKQQTFAGAESQMSSELKLHEKKLAGHNKQSKNRNPILVDREDESSPFEKLSVKNNKGSNSQQDNSGKNKLIFSQNQHHQEPSDTQKDRNKDQSPIINPFLISPPRGVAYAGEVDEILMDEDANSNKLISGSPYPSTNQLVKSSDNTRLSLSKLNNSDSDYTQINPNKHSFENSKAYQSNNYNNNTHLYPEKDSPQLASINKTPTIKLNNLRQFNQNETTPEIQPIGLPATISNHSQVKKEEFNIFLQPPSNQSQKRLVTNSPSKERLIQEEKGVVSMEDLGEKHQHEHESQGESENIIEQKEDNPHNKDNNLPDDNLFGGFSSLKFDSFDPEVDIAQSA